jgi:hypothetical protein
MAWMLDAGSIPRKISDPENCHCALPLSTTKAGGKPKTARARTLHIFTGLFLCIWRFRMKAILSHPVRAAFVLRALLHCVWSCDAACAFDAVLFACAVYLTVLLAFSALTLMLR